MIREEADLFPEEDLEDDVVKRDKTEKDSGDISPEVARLEEFYKVMEEENLHELEVKHGESQIKLVKHPQFVHLPSPTHLPHAEHPASGEQAQKPPQEKGLHINSPLAGVFYRSRSPQSPPFVKEGDMVTPDKSLCIVEAMKVMNEINAGMNGKILKILVENGKPVEANQPLFVVEPT